MAQYQRKTNAEAISDIKNKVISKYLDSHRLGLINPSDIFLISAERQILKLKNNTFGASDFISFYIAQAIVAAAKGQLEKSEKLFLKALDLNPNDLDTLSDYNNILVGNGRFDEAREFIESHFSNRGTNHAFLFNLYICNLSCLDFSSFLKYYEAIRYKDVLSKDSKEELELLYGYANQMRSMAGDLNNIGIDIPTYSEFFEIIYKFHRKMLHDPFNISCTVENDEEQYVFVEIFADVTIEESLFLTSKFENILVEHALKSGRNDILSKFLVYYKSFESLQEDNNELSSEDFLEIDEGQTL